MLARSGQVNVIHTPLDREGESLFPWQSNQKRNLPQTAQASFYSKSMAILKHFAPSFVPRAPASMELTGMDGGRGVSLLHLISQWPSGGA